MAPDIAVRLALASMGGLFLLEVRPLAQIGDALGIIYNELNHYHLKNLTTIPLYFKPLSSLTTTAR